MIHISSAEMVFSSVPVYTENEEIAMKSLLKQIEIYWLFPSRTHFPVEKGGFFWRGVGYFSIGRLNLQVSLKQPHV